jgi:hypothetical protein
VDGVVEVFVEQRTEEDRSCFERKRASLPRANEQHHPDCAFPQLAPGQPIHMASCPVCTLASAFSPCPYHISQSRPLSLAVVMEAAGSEGYMHVSKSRVLYTSATPTSSLAHDIC